MNFSAGLGRACRCSCLAVFRSYVAPLSRRYARNQRGTIAIIFAMVLTMVVSVVGGAVDYARWLSAKTATIGAMDVAVLAGGRALLVGKSSEEAIDIAETYYAKNKSSLLSLDNVSFSIQNQNEVVAVSDSAVDTAFLGVAGIDELRIRATASARVEVGANAGSHVEIALMLDTTGSMAGDKMVALKQAAIDLVNITIWSDQSEYTSRVVTVPFSPYVNPGRYAFGLFAARQFGQPHLRQGALEREPLHGPRPECDRRLLQLLHRQQCL
jgi:Flp pilus assembly protein TadG